MAMDPLSIALAVVGFIPACNDAFNFIQKACEAEKGATTQSQSIDLIKTSFIVWCQTWEISLNSTATSDMRKDSLFIRMLRETDAAPGILRNLLWICQIFNDADELQSDYGIKINSVSGAEMPAILEFIEEGDIMNHLDDMETLINPLTTHMNILTKLKFAIRGEDKFKALINTLQLHVENLYRTCPESKAHQMSMNMVRMCSETNRNEHDLKCLADAATVMAQSSRLNTTYELVASIASVRTNLSMVLREKVIELDPTAFEYNIRGWQWNKGAAELAVDNHAAVYRYIEWKSDDTIDSVADIQQLAKILCMKGLPKQLGFLPCIGIFRHQLIPSKYGFVFKVPWHIESRPRNNSKMLQYAPLLRLPETLYDRIEKPQSAPLVPSLNQRIAIAKAIVQNVITLHAVGWVHKSIRASSILFLPEQSTSDPHGLSPARCKDLDNPILAGYAASRSDLGGLHRSDSITRATDHRTLTKWRDDIYQFPLKRKDPRTPYRRIFDIYSLGCVLLEIGFWQTLDSFQAPSHHNEPELFRDSLLGMTLDDELQGQVGRIYAEAVKACLSVTGLETPEQAQTLLINRVAYRLDQINV